jgi:hypothetical protein
MIDSRTLFRFYVLFISIAILASAPVFSQPPGGGADQPQMGQNNQRGQGGAPGGGQMQQGQGGQQSQGFGQGMGQGQQTDQTGQRQNMIISRLKQMLGATDQEWTIIEPKVLKVYSLISSQSRGFQMRSLTGRSTDQGNTQSRSNRAAASTGDKTLEELQTLLDNSEATTSQIKSKLSEVRKAREKANEELAKAQKELQELLTLKQEAILVSVGLLE